MFSATTRLQVPCCFCVMVSIDGAALSAAVYPYVETGPLDGAAPRSLALVTIGLAVVGGLGALLAAQPKKA